MMGQLFKVEMRRTIIMLKRYPTEFFGMFLVIILLFGFLFFSANYVAGPAAMFGNRLDNLIVGYFVWSLALFSSTSIATEITNEGLVGTIEQLFLSPIEVRKILLVRSVSSLIVNLVMSFAVMILLLVITGRTLTFEIIVIIPFATAVLAIYGIAFLVGGLSLMVKRIYQLLPLLQFSLLVLVIAPINEWDGWVGLLGIFFAHYP